MVGDARIIPLLALSSISSGAPRRRSAEKDLARDEQDDELDAAPQALRIAFRRQFGHPCLDLLRMLSELGGLDLFALRLEGFQVSLKRGLRIDRDPSAAAEVDHHVGTRATVFAVDSDLLLEIAVLFHPGQFHDPAQLDLAPASAHHRRLQRLSQIGGFGLENPIGLGE